MAATIADNSRNACQDAIELLDRMIIEATQLRAALKNVPAELAADPASVQHAAALLTDWFRTLNNEGSWELGTALGDAITELDKGLHGTGFLPPWADGWGSGWDDRDRAPYLKAS